MEDQNVNAVAIPTEEEIKAALNAEPDIVQFESDEERALAAKILPALTKKVLLRVEAEKAKELSDAVSELRAENQKMIEAELEKMRKENQPPTPSEIEAVLKQEYVEFEFKIIERNKTQREFVIRELPQAQEMKFVKNLQRTLVPRLKELSSIDFQNAMSVTDKVQKMIDAVPEVMDMLAEDCAICLDPYEQDGITKEWVQKNLSSFRIMSVIEAQVLAGKFRDFFSSVYRFIPG